MEISNNNFESATTSPPIHWGHFGTILAAIVLLLGMTWMKQPQLFSFNKSRPVADSADVPKYYAYVQPAEDAQPLVAGASTNDGPMLINEDKTVTPINAGDVLGAATSDVTLNVNDIKVKTVANSDAAITKYLADSAATQSGPIDNDAFESALSSGDQNLINAQAAKLIGIRDALQQLVVPVGLVKLHQLTVIQFNAAIGVLQNFTQADNNPELVGQYLSQFLKSQQDLETESALVAQKYNIDPLNLGAVPIDASSADISSSANNNATP